jgi:Rieske Fe-S protein
MSESDREPVFTAPDGKPQSEQPRWRKDFPIDWPEDHYIARRDFTKFLVLTSLAFTVGQFWIGFQNILRRRRGAPPLRFIAEADKIPVGGALGFSYPDEHDQCVLVRLDHSTFAAFSQECTHLSCSVVPDPENQCFRCPCHEGQFEIATGRPMAGPPRRPLVRVKLEFQQGGVYASGIEERTS